MYVALHILNGRRAGERVLLCPPQAVCIGRTEHADHSLPCDPALSQRHFRISLPRADACRIEDLGSTNGTFVNGKRVLFGQLRAGDVISAGMTEFRVCW